MKAITRTLTLALLHGSEMERVYVRSSDALRELRAQGFVALCLAFSVYFGAASPNREQVAPLAAVRLQHAQVSEAFYLVPAIELEGRSLVRLEDALPAAHGLDEQRHMPQELAAICKGVQLANLATIEVYVERPIALALAQAQAQAQTQTQSTIQVTFVGVSL